MGEPVSLEVFTREQKICLALWRKAFKEKDSGKPPVSLVLSSKSTALSTRLAFYRAIKPFRDEKLLDPELRQAAEQFAVTIREYDPTTGTWELALTEKKFLAELEAQLSALGISEEDLLTPEERETLARLADFLTPDEVHKPSSTPFYERP